jgi:hypothetical protein
VVPSAAAGHDVRGRMGSVELADEGNPSGMYIGIGTLLIIILLLILIF